MSIEANLISYLLLESGISALVSNRIYPEKLPAQTTAQPTSFPAITCLLVDEPVMTTYTNDQWFKARIQIDAWGSSYKSAHTVADAIHTALQGFRGNLGDNKVGGVFRQRRNDASEPDIELMRVSQDYMINYS